MATQDIRTVVDGVTIALNEGTKKLEALGLKNNTTSVSTLGSNPPNAGDVLKATSANTAQWGPVPGGGGGGGRLTANEPLIGQPGPNTFVVSDGTIVVQLPAAAVANDRAGVWCLSDTEVTPPAGQVLFWGNPDNSVTQPDTITLPGGAYAEWVCCDLGEGSLGWLPLGASNEGSAGSPGGGSALVRADDDQNPQPGEWGFVGDDDVNVPDTDVLDSRFGVAVDRGRTATLFTVGEPSNTSIQLGNTIYDAGYNLPLRGGGYYEWVLAAMGEGSRWVPSGMSAEQPAPLQWRRFGSGIFGPNEWVSTSDFSTVVELPYGAQHGDRAGVLVDSEGADIRPPNGYSLRSPTAEQEVDYPDSINVTGLQFYEWIFDANQTTWVPVQQTAYLRADPIFSAIFESAAEVFYIGDTIAGTDKSIRGVKEPTLADEAANKSYVDTKISAASIAAASIAYGPAVAVAVGGANQDGVSDAISRADHRHALIPFGVTSNTIMQGNQAAGLDASGTLNALTVTQARGLKTTTGVVSVSAAVPPVAGQTLVATGPTAATWQSIGGGGVAFGSVVPMTVGGAGVDGVATSASHSDHVHAFPAFGTISGTLLEGNAAAGGDCSGTLSNLSVTQARGLKTSTGVVTVSAASSPITGTVLTATSGTTATWQGTGFPKQGTLTIAANTTALVSNLYLVDSTSGVITVTLPPCASVVGKDLTIKRIAGANNVVIDGDTTETIDGALTLTLTFQYEWATLLAAASGWYQIS